MSIYTVFAVDAGDRLTLVMAKQDGSAEFKQVLLSHISCPKLGRRSASGEISPEEPCSADAQELIRAACIGKSVKFVEEGSVPELQRSTGQLYLPDGSNAAVALLKAGLATINERGPKAERSLHDQLTAAVNAAKSAKVGLWAHNSKNQVRRIEGFPMKNATELAEKMKGKEIKVRVERVQSGYSLLVMPLDELQQYVVNMSGIFCASALKKDAEGNVDPLGVEAKLHSERFLLHRNVTIRFEGIDQFGNFLGSVVSPKGTFQEDLLKRGLARILGSSLANCKNHQALVEAERAGQKARVGLWTNFEESAAAAAVVTDGADNEAPVTQSYEGTLIQALNGDTCLIREATEKGFAYHRVSLAGVRACKDIKKDVDPREVSRAPEVRSSYESYSWEAKEFMRKFIGSALLVTVEFTRTFEDSKEVRQLVTLRDVKSGTNLGAALLKDGLGKFQLGRSDVCSCADELSAAESFAKERKIRIHSGKPSQITHLTEINRVGEKKGRQYLSFLHTGAIGTKYPTWKAVVEVALSGSSFRVYIPHHHFVVTVKLAGVMSPASAGPNGEAADPLAAESKDFAITTLQQRDCDVCIEAADKTGSFIGYININGKSFGAQIIEAGLAVCANADRALNGTELQACEARAKAAQRGIWSSVDNLPARLKKQMSQRTSGPTTFSIAENADWKTVRITDVADPSSVCVVELASTESQAAMTDILATFVGTESKPYAARRDELVAAFFKEDRTWNRAKVIGVRDKVATVSFIDFGNQTQVALKDLRAIPKDPAFELLHSTPALARHVRLAFLKTMSESNEYWDDALNAAWEYAQSSENFEMRTEYSDDKKHSYVTLATTRAASSLQEFLVSHGLGFVDESAKAATTTMSSSIFSSCSSKMQEARKTHKGMWCRGDIDEEDF